VQQPIATLAVALPPEQREEVNVEVQEEEDGDEEAREEETAGQSGDYNSKQTFGIDEEFDKLTGHAKYLGSDYRDNYNLDLEETGLTGIVDSAANGLANAFFIMLKGFATVVCAIVYFCLDFSLADTISDFITQLQTGLIKGIFQELWILSAVVMFVSIVGKLFKRQMAEILKDLAMVVFVTVLSVLLMSHTKEVLTASTNLTKSVSNSVFVGLDTATGMSGDVDYATNAAGSLWTDMIHEPWLTLEFGSVAPDDAVVDEILSLRPGSSDRADIIKDMTKETGCFDKERAWGRLGMIFVYMIPFFLKGVIFITISLLQALAQVLAVFVILLAAFVLFLAIMPNYGMEILKKWMQMFFDAHLGMVILSFLMAMMIWLNKVLYSFAGTYGWLISLLFQAALCIVLSLNFKVIMLTLLYPRNTAKELNRKVRQSLRTGGRHPSGSRNNDYNYENGFDEYDEYDDYNDYEDYDYEDYGHQKTHESNRSSLEQSMYKSSSANKASPDSDTRGEQDYQSDNHPTSPTDYQAMHNAPSQQELYNLFNSKSGFSEPNRDEEGIGEETLDNQKNDIYNSGDMGDNILGGKLIPLNDNSTDATIPEDNLEQPENDAEQNSITEAVSLEESDNAEVEKITREKTDDSEHEASEPELDEKTVTIESEVSGNDESLVWDGSSEMPVDVPIGTHETALSELSGEQEEARASEIKNPIGVLEQEITRADTKQHTQNPIPDTSQSMVPLNMPSSENHLVSMENSLLEQTVEHIEESQRGGNTYEQQPEMARPTSREADIQTNRISMENLQEDYPDNKMDEIEQAEPEELADFYWDE
jgi:hypothetical protein